MRVPTPLQPLLDQGIIDRVLRPLMAGKEAQVYLVEAEGWICVAKTFKDSAVRSFKHRAEYIEGRKVRNSRQQRAMDKGSRYGREQIEEAWRNAEVDAIYRLREAGVRVPEPYAFVDGVLVMELIQDEFGEPAPRLVDVSLTEDEAWDLFHHLLREVVKMLCAGVVHGDLSDFNVLLGWDGPVIIDFPQAIDPASNQNARKLLIRDVNNLASFLARYTDRLKKKQYGEEMWALYEAGKLTPDSELTGRHQSNKKANMSALLAEIEAVEREARMRREALGLEPRRPARKPRVEEPARPAPQEPKRGRHEGGGHHAGRRDGGRKEGGGADGRHRGDSRRDEPRGREPRRDESRGREPRRDESRAREPRRDEPRHERSRKPEPPPPGNRTPQFETSDDLDAFLLAED